MSDNRKHHQEKPKTNAYIIWGSIVIAGLAFMGYILLGFDGWCAGGSFCRGAPGLPSAIGALFIALGVQTFILISNKSKQKPTRLADWIWTPIVALGVFSVVTLLHYIT